MQAWHSRRRFGARMRDGSGAAAAGRVVEEAQDALRQPVDAAREGTGRKADVAARREIESDRAKPRSTARWVTLITVSVLGVLALTGDYIAPYGTPIGQMFLVLLLGMYVATLVWMRRMSTGKPLPRFIGSAAKAAAR